MVKAILLAIVCFVAVALGQPGNERESNKQLRLNPTHADVRKFLTEVETQTLPEADHDSRGWPSSLTLLGNHACDQGLILASRVSSLRSLVIHGRNAGIACTERGASALQALTNLTALKILCTGPLQPGFFKGVCQLRNLRELQLTAAMPPSEEYLSLSRLEALRKLGIANCTNFGDTEIGVFTNLASLETLDLVNNAVSYDGTNVLTSLSSLKKALFIK